MSPSLPSIRKYLKRQKITLKKVASKLSTQQHKDRDEQFKQIKRLRTAFLKSGNTVISVDTKKKELIGLLKVLGRVWRKVAKCVLDHDFSSLAKAKVVPFGIYDLKHNRGNFYCNTSHETSEFLAEMIAMWWEETGRFLYPDKNRLLIFCDAGGANGYKRHGWKVELQEKLVSKYGLQVTVCHYPTGASKWNPIEHKLFSYVSINMAGEPLESVEKFLSLIRSTTTKKGLVVEAQLIEKEYKTGLECSSERRNRVNIQYMALLPDWNYTIFP